MGIRDNIKSSMMDRICTGLEGHKADLDRAVYRTDGHLWEVPCLKCRQVIPISAFEVEPIIGPTALDDGQLEFDFLDPKPTPRYP